MYKVAAAKTGYSGIIKDSKRVDFAKSNEDLFKLARDLKEGYTPQSAEKQVLEETKDLQRLFKQLLNDKNFLNI